MTDETRARISTDLTGQVAVVTGAARGLGRAIAQTLAGAGAKVACVDVSQGTLADSVDAIRAAGGTAQPWACDVTDGDRAGEVVAEVIDKLGGLDILVNNAGITRDTVIVRMSDEEWDDVIETNLKGAFFQGDAPVLS